MKRRTFVAGIGAAAGMTCATPILGQSLDTVNIGAVNSVADTPFLIADRKGYFRDVGIKANFVPFDSAALMVAPLGTGQLDVGGGAPSAGLYNAVSRGIGIKIVADRGSDPPGYGFQALYVRKDLVAGGKYKTYADLKGLKVAEPAKGTSVLCQLVKACERGRIKYDDLDHVYLGFSDQIVALRNASIDATIALEPWGTVAGNDGYAIRVTGSDAFYPNEQITVVVYGNDFVEKKPDVAKRFMVAYVRACRYYHDALRDGHLAGSTAADIITILSTSLKVDPQILRQMYAASIDANARLNVDSLVTDYGIYKQAGLLTGEVAMNSIVDMSFADAAAKTLGPYRQAR